VEKIRREASGWQGLSYFVSLALVALALLRTYVSATNDYADRKRLEAMGLEPEANKNNVTIDLQSVAYTPCLCAPKTNSWMRWSG
jgi:hypothetical protein